MHIVLIGCSVPKLARLMSCVRDSAGHRVSYVVTAPKEVEELIRAGVGEADIHRIEEAGLATPPDPTDIAFLASLESEDVPTIHNMILSDRVLQSLPYPETLAYAARMAQRLQQAVRSLKTTVLLGGHDRLMSSMGLAIARAEGVPWFAFNFSVIPVGYVALSERMIPSDMVRLRELPDAELDVLANRLLTEFEERRLRAPAYVSAHSVSLAVRRLAVHVPEALKSLRQQLAGHPDRYGDFSVGLKIRQYLRKRWNMLAFPRSWFLTAPPPEPFVFFGLHMQPESSIDVYAPFHSRQFGVIEKIARAIPPTHSLLVKLHISDADNYSRAQLRQLTRLPGVKLVLPTVLARPFIDRCAALMTIAGTMGLEGALLGKPVIAFGRMNYAAFPSVRCVRDLYDLPQLVRDQLAAAPPSREAILAAYKRYLGAYFCATGPGTTVQINDWTHPHPSPEEYSGFVELFASLDGYVTREASRDGA